MSDNERIIAILPAGYADGLNRKLGNRNGNLYIKVVKEYLLSEMFAWICVWQILPG